MRILTSHTSLGARITLSLAFSAGMASSEPKTDCAVRAPSAIAKVNSPATLYGSFRAFRDCDEKDVSELFTLAVTRMLALQWASFSQLQSLAATDLSFKEFILRHIDASTPPETLRRIAFNAQHSCPDRSQSFCAEVRHAIEALLRGSPAAATMEETAGGRAIATAPRDHSSAD